MASENIAMWIQTGNCKVKELFAVLFVLVVILTQNSFCERNKYSKDSNKDISKLMNEIRPFRMKKPNLLWTYGRKQKYLSYESKMELFKELENYDRLEIKLKKLRSENLDQDGLVEKKSLYFFKRIVERYALGDNLMEEYHESSNIVTKPTKNSDKPQVYFEDSKLKEMWREAINSGFSEEDLELLKEEFTHQQLKIDEFAMMHNEDFDHHNDLDDETDEEIDPKKRDSLDVKLGFHRLEQIAQNLVTVDGEFEDARINSLWNVAKNIKWSKKKLDSFKEELHHFEKRISKQKIYAENLKKSLQFSDHRQAPDHHEFLEKRNDMLTKEVKKIHDGLKERLSKAIKHNEL